MEIDSVRPEQQSPTSLRKSVRNRKRPVAPDASYRNGSSGSQPVNHTTSAGSPPLAFPDHLPLEPRDEALSDNGRAQDEQESETEEDPIWQEFSSDYYQVVEQLPLELARNLALLKELDEQTQRQTGTLLELIRKYVSARLKSPTDKPGMENHATPNGQHDDHGTIVTLPVNDSPNPANSDLETRPTDKDSADKPDTDTATSVIESRPLRVDEEQAIPKTPFTNEQTSQLCTSPNSVPQKLYSLKLNSSLLPSISNLAKELLRSSDEQLALASGCYSLVDRHVQSLDAAIQVQQTAIRQDLEQALNTTTSDHLTGHGDSSLAAMAASTNGGLPLGPHATHPAIAPTLGWTDATGGGKATSSDQGPIPIVLGYVAAQSFDLKVDPNEPRYCYCENVSHGEMIGCEASRWFDLFF